jgi:hypothetical protein
VNQEQQTQEEEHSAFSLAWRTRIEGKGASRYKCLVYAISIQDACDGSHCNSWNIALIRWEIEFEMYLFSTSEIQN